MRGGASEASTRGGRGRPGPMAAPTVNPGHRRGAVRTPVAARIREAAAELLRLALEAAEEDMINEEPPRAASPLEGVIEAVGAAHVALSGVRVEEAAPREPLVM